MTTIFLILIYFPESEILYIPRPATNSMPIHMDNVHCSVGELTLLDCSYGRNTINNRHLEDVGMKCGNCKLIYVTSQFQVHKVLKVWGMED